MYLIRCLKSSSLHIVYTCERFGGEPRSLLLRDRVIADDLSVGALEVGEVVCWEGGVPDLQAARTLESYRCSRVGVAEYARCRVD